MPNIITLALAGVRRGNIVAIEVVDKTRYGLVWLCRCDCGRELRMPAAEFNRGKRTSCGCIGKHGLINTPTYRSWHHMIQRTTNDNMDPGGHYKARGIKVCERWLKFENFVADMGERPEGMTIDRFSNNDGDYEPGNCRWATADEQAHNRRDTVLTVALVGQIRARYANGESITAIRRRLGLGRGVVDGVVHRRSWKNVP